MRLLDLYYSAKELFPTLAGASLIGTVVFSLIYHLYKGNSGRVEEEPPKIIEPSLINNSEEVILYTPENVIKLLMEHVEKPGPTSTESPLFHYMYYFIKMKNKMLECVLVRDEKILNHMYNRFADYKMDYTFNQEILEKYLDGTVIVPREAIILWLEDPKYCLVFVQALLEHVIKNNPDDYSHFILCTKLFFENTSTKGCYALLDDGFFLTPATWFLKNYLIVMDLSDALTFHGVLLLM
jgi:hypothetical protein